MTRGEDRPVRPQTETSSYHRAVKIDPDLTTHIAAVRSQREIRCLYGWLM